MRRRRWSCTTFALALAVLASACSLALDTAEFSRPASPSSDAVAPSADADAGGSVEDAGPEACGAVDLQTNPQHCGRCGRDCAGGECVGGACTPVVLMRDLGDPIGVAVAGDAVYVGAHGKILRTGLAGGGAVEVAGPTQARYMAASATHLYWTDGDSVLRWPLGGGAIETIVPNVPSSMGVALSANHVYFSTYTKSGTVERAFLDGGSRETIIGPYDRPEDIEFADGELLVGGDGANELAVFANAGLGSKRVLSSGEEPVAMAVWGSDVFFVRQGDDTIRRVPIAGGVAERLADSGGQPCGIAVNADSVYWVTCEGGRLFRLVR